jgi:hypothetical protein
VTAATYVATESITPKLFGDTLGYPLTARHGSGRARTLTGVPALTFVIVAVNELLHAALGVRTTSRGDSPAPPAFALCSSSPRTAHGDVASSARRPTPGP